jgi:hypothetical protein
MMSARLGWHYMQMSLALSAPPSFSANGLNKSVVA